MTTFLSALFHRKRFTLGTQAVVNHGVIQLPEKRERWVREIDRSAGTQYVYRVLVDDVNGTALSGHVEVATEGRLRKFELRPEKDTIPNFRLCPMSVSFPIKLSQNPELYGEQDIAVAVRVNYPQGERLEQGGIRIQVGTST